MNVHHAVGYSSLGAVAIAIIVGLFLVGSPEEQRLLGLDRQRLADLRGLVRAVESYWEDNSALPTQLEELVDGRRLSRLPLDPATNVAYEYRATDANGYRVCANFSVPSADDTSEDFWFHAAGRHCYSFDLSAIERIE